MSFPFQNILCYLSSDFFQVEETYVEGALAYIKPVLITSNHNQIINNCHHL